MAVESPTTGVLKARTHSGLVSFSSAEVPTLQQLRMIPFTPYFRARSFNCSSGMVFPFQTDLWEESMFSVL
jgi:hypothetical protein